MPSQPSLFQEFFIRQFPDGKALNGQLHLSAGELVTREEIRSVLWPEDTFVDFDHSLGTAVNKLREVLGDSASNPRFVETAPRRGYRFIAPVVAVNESEDTAAVSEASPAV
jgi:DNA-binding winged helix-turn-helix (wHTH) protein